MQFPRVCEMRSAAAVVAAVFAHGKLKGTVSCRGTDGEITADEVGRDGSEGRL